MCRIAGVEGKLKAKDSTESRMIYVLHHVISMVH